MIIKVKYKKLIIIIKVKYKNLIIIIKVKFVIILIVIIFFKVKMGKFKIRMNLLFLKMKIIRKLNNNY